VRGDSTKMEAIVDILNRATEEIKEVRS